MLPPLPDFAGTNAIEIGTVIDFIPPEYFHYNVREDPRGNRAERRRVRRKT